MNVIVADLAGARVDTGRRRPRVASPSSSRAGAPRSEVRKARDLVWLQLHRAGFSVPQIAAMHLVDRTTVYRRLRQMGVELGGGLGASA